MPTRILRDGILTSEPVCSLTWPSEVFYRRLMSVVDDYGRFSANFSLLRSACYPLQVDKVGQTDVGKWLTECVRAGLVRTYTTQDGKVFLEVVKFNQRIQRESKYPPPPQGLPEVAEFHGDSPQKTAVVVVEGVVEGVVEKTAGLEIPNDLQTHKQAIEAWLAYKKSRREGYKIEHIGIVWKRMRKLGAGLSDAIEQAISNGWMGFDQNKGHARPNARALAVQDQQAGKWDKFDDARTKDAGTTQGGSGREAGTPRGNAA